jgi:hypothetical protein
MSTCLEQTMEKKTSSYPTQHKWNVWIHPDPSDWSPSSYTNIGSFSTVKTGVSLMNLLPDTLIENCMLFVMKDGILPLWEDPRNKNGGAFSYKIPNKIVHDVWRNLTYILAGETLSSNENFVKQVTGISISPKKKFCVIKIWLETTQFQNPKLITTEIKGLNPTGCLFKTH